MTAQAHTRIQFRNRFIGPHGTKEPLGLVGVCRAIYF